MGFRKTFYIQAQDEIKARKTANESLLIKRQEEISKKFNKYNALKKELADTGSLLIKILGGGKNIQNQIRELSERNLTLQMKIEELLLNGRYPKNYLNPVYTCQKCSDSGIYQDTRCDCFHEILKRLASNELNKSSPIKISSFVTFDLGLYPDENDSITGQNIKKSMTQNFNYCKQYADDFHLPGDGILMCGGTGLGKTHLSLAIANEVLSKGYGVIYGSAPDLFRKIEKEHFSKEPETDTLGLLQSADLLILDDLGAEFENKLYASVLYNLLNSRMNRGTPTIINTNLDFKGLKERYSDRIMSRLMTSKVLFFFGRDIRILRKNLK